MTLQPLLFDFQTPYQSKKKNNISNTKLDDHDDYNQLKIGTCVIDKASGSNVFIWQDKKKEEYQLACHTFHTNVSGI